MTAPTISPRITRLLTGYHETGGTAGLHDHLRRHGPPPLSGRRAGPAAGERLIRIIEQAGLTGRGGGAFPTARKLRAVASARRPGVVVVNGGEGEPLSGKDRLLLAVAPHLVLDGAALAAEAVGAGEIIVCVHSGGRVRAEVARAIADRDEARLTTVPTRVSAIPDRYVASEETALVGWLNDGRALPAYTPPRPFERGVGGRPTLISNAETYAHIALIARHGPQWFRACGTPDAPGTALFTVSGAVRRPGVVEAPLGTTLLDLLRLAGEATEPLQAVLVGGYGGAWLSADHLGTPATPAALRAAGSALGPGIVVALPGRACGLAETARVLTWLADQTAGQCGPCVFGLPAIADDFARIAACAADPQVYRRLRDRLTVIPGRGACRHPDGAVRLAAGALRVFAAHVGVHQRSDRCLSARRPGVVTVPSGW
ncbi:MAG TPA: NADH-ubiquinone oxidoreductase-F iron-sulfur binding region domain-containing protein [Streptosporangiaceae bacterium]|nr:NADH-ubiquinone oxidoreductase-F iron-sulfur binding region domain-containing protein [Streptosporangiaceae bacterium]